RHTRGRRQGGAELYRAVPQDAAQGTHGGEDRAGEKAQSGGVGSEIRLNSVFRLLSKCSGSYCTKELENLRVNLRDIQRRERRCAVDVPMLEYLLELRPSCSVAVSLKIEFPK